MKPATAWALFTAVLIGVALWLTFAGRHSEPPADIAALELVRGDINETGSCFSLGAVLAANQLDGTASDVDVLWTTRVRDEWTLRVDRKRSWRAYTFVRQEGRLLPVRVAFSDDLPQLGLEAAVDELLHATSDGSVPRVARCGGD
jgi:hypothetical protein